MPQRHAIKVWLDAITKPLWKMGIYGERVKTERLPDGGVRIVLELGPDEVLDEKEPRGDPKALGASVGAMPPPKK